MMRSHAPHLFSRPAAFLSAFVLFAIAWGIIGVGSANADKRSVTVMTQNLYQGTEFAHIASLKAGATDAEVIAATTADYATYQATNFKARAKQIAAEIAKNKPVLVGLQEVATWHKGPFDPLNQFALPPEVSEDFTEVLVQALAAEGVHYQAVSKTTRPEGNFTLAFPVFPGPSPYFLTAVGMVENGVILASTDLPSGQLKLSNSQSGTYNIKIEVPNPKTGSLIPFTDSWQSIDAKVRGKTFRFITTHLDSLDPSGFARAGQAQELVKGPASTTLPVVVTGDMNSGPKTLPLAYGALLAGGLSDTWTAAGLGAPPLTCCHLEKEDRVNNPLDEYKDDLDHVFTRGDFTVLDEHLVGNEAPTSPPASFLWPSDHAGMVATLQIGPGMGAGGLASATS